MDNQDLQKNQSPSSIFKGEEFSISKILARESSVGQSSRIYYQNTTNEGVPFKWERQPGRPKNPPLAEIIPPPTPPPAVRSLALPRPKHVDSSSQDLMFWRFWSWRRLISKNLGLKRYEEKGRCTRFNNKHAAAYSDGDSDAEFMGWVHHDSRSSSSSSSSSLGSHTERLTRGPFPCSPWRNSE